MANTKTKPEMTWLNEPKKKLKVKTLGLIRSHILEAEDWLLIVRSAVDQGKGLPLAMRGAIDALKRVEKLMNS